MKRFQIAALVVCFWLALLPAAYSQAVSSSISGTVKDPAGAVVVGAPVQLINNISKEARHASTNKNGSFKFLSVLQGTYTLRIVQPGFQTYVQNDVV
ncbi:MAG TPA: carboxypeptidase-like regulatory domain-containing protein, partial [Bryobacteraceae bacterium]